MRMYGDLNNPDGPDGDGTIDESNDWFDSPQDDNPDNSEADFGDGGSLRPWKTTDI